MVGHGQLIGRTTVGDGTQLCSGRGGSLSVSSRRVQFEGVLVDLLDEIGCVQRSTGGLIDRIVENN